MAMGIGLMRGTDTRLGWAVWGLGFAVVVLQRIPGVFNALGRPGQNAGQEPLG